MNTLCPHIFISKSLLKYLPAHFDIINWTLDIFRNRDFSAVANFQLKYGQYRNIAACSKTATSDVADSSEDLRT